MSGRCESTPPDFFLQQGTDEMGILEAKGITKIFPGVVALEDVNLSVQSGEIHCVVGENGAGKSTLVKVLTGLYKAEKGVLLIEGKEVDLHDKHSFKKVSYVPQELDLFENMTVAENLFIPFDKEGFKSSLFDKRKWEKEAVSYIEKLHMKVKPSDIVKNIPVSDQQLLQVARAVSNVNSKVIILDEPTTALTTQEIRRLFKVITLLKQEGKAIIFISHKLDEVFELGDVVSVLRNGQLVGNAKLADITANWIIKKMSGEDIDVNQCYRPARPRGDKILEVNKLSGNRFNDISFSLHEGEILGFAGLVGAGRTEVMQTLFGYLPEKGGVVWFKGKKWRFRDTAYSIKNGVIYLTEERKTHGILAHLSVRDNIGIVLSRKVAKGGILNKKKDLAVTKRVMEEYNVKAASSEVKMLFLSGGNQQKVLIGRSMEASPQVLIFDEPTKGIDVKTKEEIYRLMQYLAEEERVAIVLISSELEELLKCSNRVITMYNGSVHCELCGEQLTTENVLSSVIGIKDGVIWGEHEIGK